jgi:hypothetical protein
MRLKGASTMKRTAWITLLVLFCLVYPAAAQTPTPTPRLEFTTQTDPASLIGAFYNAIALGDYARAYSYWESAPQNLTEAQFAAGFADTTDAHVLVRLPIATDAGAGNVFASIPVLVTAEHTDGTTHYYAGCFTAHKTNVPIGDALEPDPNWYIREGTLSEQASPDFTALDTACETTYTLIDNPFPASQLDALQVVEAYFTAVARDDAATAATYWERPEDDVFAEQYSIAYTAQSINLLVNPESFGEGAAGSVYVTVPTLVILNISDTVTYYVTGCYTARGVNVPVGDAETPDPNWHLYSATLREVTEATDAVTTLGQGCTQ